MGNNLFLNTGMALTRNMVRQLGIHSGFKHKGEIPEKNVSKDPSMESITKIYFDPKSESWIFLKCQNFTTAQERENKP